MASVSDVRKSDRHDKERSLNEQCMKTPGSHTIYIVTIPLYPIRLRDFKMFRPIVTDFLHHIHQHDQILSDRESDRIVSTYGHVNVMSTALRLHFCPVIVHLVSPLRGCPVCPLCCIIRAAQTISGCSARRP